ncbi:MAG TPA: chromate transporter [Spirochaetia bacterium]|nr:chromate transporter [Spirochaetia bacterium]
MNGLAAAAGKDHIAMNRRLSLFLRFLRLGFFTIGGGYAMVPLIEREVVDDSHWLTREDYYKTILLTQSVPGPIAVNTAFVVGRQIAGLSGGLVSASGVVLPSFAIILVIAINFASFHNVPVVEAVFRGIRTAVVALIAAAGVRLARERIELFTFVLAAAGLAAILFLNVSPFLLVLAFIAAGISRAYIRQRRSGGTSSRDTGNPADGNPADGQSEPEDGAP